jgi:hypothetical protein
VFGSAAVLTLFSDPANPSNSSNTFVAACIAAAISAAQAVDMVVGSVTRARVHHDLVRRFTLVERRMIQHEPSAESYATAMAERLDIEAEEPPTKQVLDIMCHNDMIRAEDRDEAHLVEVGLAQRCLSQFFDLRAHHLRKQRGTQGAS